MAIGYGTWWKCAYVCGNGDFPWGWLMDDGIIELVLVLGM